MMPNESPNGVPATAARAVPGLPGRRDTTSQSPPGDWCDHGVSVTGPRYYPMVCSIEDGAIAEVISAIDQLAEDAGSGLAAHELNSRVAAIWAMLADLDPEVARLRAAYEHPRPD